MKNLEAKLDKAFIVVWSIVCSPGLLCLWLFNRFAFKFCNHEICHNYCYTDWLGTSIFPSVIFWMILATYMGTTVPK